MTQTQWLSAIWNRFISYQFRPRPSPLLIFNRTLSVLKRLNKWLKHCTTIWWDTGYPVRFHIHHYTSIQTLTTLILHNNEIGAEGAQHLAHALHNNTVTQLVFWSITYSPLYINIDTSQSQSLQKPYRSWRGTTSSSSTAQQHSERIFHRIDSIVTIIHQYRHSPLSNLN
jgi:hypothetical protein